jgi:hypothetical protein
MGAHPPKETSAIAQIVRETIETVASPDVATRVIEEALAAEGLDAVPDSEAALRAFVNGHLARTLEDAVGSASAGYVIESLTPVLAVLAADEASRERHVVAASMRPPGTEPPPEPTPDEIARAAARAHRRGLVLLASSDAAVRDDVARALAARALVVSVPGLFELVDAWRAVLGADVILVLDGRDLRARGFTLSFALAGAPSPRMALAWRTAPDAVTALAERLGESHVRAVDDADVGALVVACGTVLDERAAALASPV